MLKRIVPTPTTLLVPVTGTGSGLAFASIRKTSRSASVNGTWAFQLLFDRSSFQVVPSNLTISPVGGAPAVEFGGNGGKLLFGTAASFSAVVRLPEWKTAAYTVEP